MDRQYIDDNHIVARYLADQLSEEERVAFEAYYLEHPDVVEEMEAAARFKAGMLELQRLGELETPAKRRSASVLPYLAVAAGIAAIALVIVFVADREPPTSWILAATPPIPLAKDHAGLAVASTHQILRTRSSGPDAIIDLPETAQAIKLEILPEVEGVSSKYRVALVRRERGEGQLLAEIGDLSMNDDGFVQVYLNSARLEPGMYLLNLSSDASAGAQETSGFSLRVQRTAR